MFSCLINDKSSLKQQLLVSYSLITIISAGITLGICYGLLYSLKNSASIAATENLLYQTDSNAKALAIEIANAINQEITIVGESICMVGARYASILLSNSHKGKLGGTILKKVCFVCLVNLCCIYLLDHKLMDNITNTCLTETFLPRVLFGWSLLGSKTLSQ